MKVLFTLAMIVVTLCLGQRMRRDIIDDVCNTCEMSCQWVIANNGTTVCRIPECDTIAAFCKSLKFNMSECMEDDSFIQDHCIRAFLLAD
uniref:Teretoxin Tan22.12 n=1 Tax=Terebra anilis TaxID=553697 RepID=TMC_TERAN|nr:RecName: Full=Teretoxin Tan22.12; Flags: Precursor [Terebra anilis]